MPDKLLEDRVSLPVAWTIIVLVSVMMIFLNYKVYRKNNPKPYSPSKVYEKATYTPNYIKPGETVKINKNISRVIKK